MWPISSRDLFTCEDKHVIFTCEDEHVIFTCEDEHVIFTCEDMFLHESSPQYSPGISLVFI